ncbi:hypothetical protein OUZ56_000917 [Daphnia magna]|uniref:Uncharacterized protein n=1 Tax=Daphnia magna TaxID=35525 RepID=A0ABR0A149_9CRUS|nr:hypothetical protein OUZ56_000917 [Daphnia magna]
MATLATPHLHTVLGDSKRRRIRWYAVPKYKQKILTHTQTVSCIIKQPHSLLYAYAVSKNQISIRWQCAHTKFNPFCALETATEIEGSLARFASAKEEETEQEDKRNK